MKTYILEKRSKWWWIVELSEAGDKMGIEGFSLKSTARKWAKYWGYDLTNSPTTTIK